MRGFGTYFVQEMDKAPALKVLQQTESQEMPLGHPPKKASLKNKKSKTRLSRNFKPSNNTPYLPPEVRLD